MLSRSGLFSGNPYLDHLKTKTAKKVRDELIEKEDKLDAFKKELKEAREQKNEAREKVLQLEIKTVRKDIIALQNLQITLLSPPEPTSPLSS